MRLGSSVDIVKLWSDVMTEEFDEGQMIADLKGALAWAKSNCPNAYYVPVHTHLLEQTIKHLEQK